MELKFLDQIGDWNPQVWRELKGRLKPRNVMIAGAVSIVGQFLLLLYCFSLLPSDPITDQLYNKYCTGSSENYSLPLCLKEAGSFVINWSLWWQDLFLAVSFIGIFTLLTAGTFLIISDLAQEERRGTLNFIRLSPRSEVSILMGKLLGVPILVYLVAVLAVPLHAWAGLAGGVSLLKILGFYSILIASCLFFYSAALLCSSVSAGRGWSLSWLGAVAVLIFLMLGSSLTMGGAQVDTPSTWLRLLSPIDTMLHVFSTSSDSMYGFWSLQWYYLPVGASVVSLIGFALLNYGVWTYWIWQALKRSFRNPTSTILSKRQSYLLVACFEVTLLGFVAQKQTETYIFWSSLTGLFWFNALLLFSLIAVLSPHRQALLDWARYQQGKRKQKKGKKQHFSLLPSSLDDLIWGEKSPAVAAMAINFAIAAIPVALWTLLWSFNDVDTTKILFGVVFFVSLMMIYATIAQRMLLMNAKKRSLWAAGTIGVLLILPPMTLSILNVNPMENPAVWLFSTVPWVGLEYAATTTIVMALLGEWSVLVLLNLQLTRQLQRAGESSSKALFAGRSSLPS